MLRAVSALDLMQQETNNTNRRPDGQSQLSERTLTASQQCGNQTI
jgi:hypothetical protein